MVRTNLSDGEPIKSVAYPPWKAGMKKVVRVAMRDDDGNRVEGKYTNEKRTVQADQKSIYNHKHMSNQVKTKPVSNDAGSVNQTQNMPIKRRLGSHASV